MPSNLMISLFATVSLYILILFVTHFDSCFLDPIIINSVLEVFIYNLFKLIHELIFPKEDSSNSMVLSSSFLSFGLNDLLTK